MDNFYPELRGKFQGETPLNNDSFDRPTSGLGSGMSYRHFDANSEFNMTRNVAPKTSKSVPLLVDHPKPRCVQDIHINIIMEFYLFSRSPVKSSIISFFTDIFMEKT